MMQLNIDTSKDVVQIGLYQDDGSKVATDSWSSQHNESEILVSKIEDLLDLNNCYRCDLKKVLVCRGFGSYTALRVGISTANSIAYSLNISIIGYRNNADIDNKASVLQTPTGDKFEKVVLPLYKKSPHITTKKTRR